MINNQVIEYIVGECRKLQGEVILQKAMFEDVTDQISPNEIMHIIFDEKKLEDFSEKLIAQKNAHEEFMKCVNYNSGRFDAYMDMLKYFGYDYNKNDDNEAK
jgi:hypothetical protein